MPRIESATLKVKNNSGAYTDLLPKTSKMQVIGWNIGEVYGPYIFTLKATDWVNKRQTIDLDGVSASDILECSKVLKGTKKEMIKQAEAYNKLKLVGGIQSLNNKIVFTCNEVPTVDFQVQVWWTR